ncbi:hypothetical protein A0257_22740 (plasmid) [Hymenobacter psoromatis]|nr:hypothetical protein A0257_22740 [Hymenobacter psoromatis]
MAKRGDSVGEIGVYLEARVESETGKELGRMGQLMGRDNEQMSRDAQWGEPMNFGVVRVLDVLG